MCAFLRIGSKGVVPCVEVGMGRDKENYDPNAAELKK